MANETGLTSRKKYDKNGIGLDSENFQQIMEIEMTNNTTIEKLCDEAKDRSTSNTSRITASILALVLAIRELIEVLPNIGISLYNHREAVRESTEALKKIAEALQRQKQEKEVLNDKGETYEIWCQRNVDLVDYDDFT